MFEKYLCLLLYFELWLVDVFPPKALFFLFFIAEVGFLNTLTKNCKIMESSRVPHEIHIAVKVLIKP